MSTSDRDLTLMFVGDVILAAPNPDFYFDQARETIQRADVAVVNVEWPHTNRGHTSSLDTNVPVPGADPAHVPAYARAGFHVATAAANHVFDQGHYGVEDTLSSLRDAGLVTVGIGLDIDEARSPGLIERDGVRFGFLNYNCVGPIATWASGSKAGCAYIEVLTHYDLNYVSPGGIPRTWTFAEPKTFEAMQEDVARLRESVDILAVAFHKGVFPSRRGVLGMYEQQVARGAIDAGADIIVGHHQTGLKGIEVYRNKVIFHGLGYFFRALQIPEDETDPRRLRLWDWKTMFARPEFEDIPQDIIDDLHSGRNQMIVSLTVGSDGIRTAGFIPCYCNDEGQPVPVGRSEVGEGVAKLVEEFTTEENLPCAPFRWDGDRVVFFSAADDTVAS